MKISLAIFLMLVAPVTARAQANAAEKPEKPQAFLIEPLGPVRAAPYWNEQGPILHPARPAIANQHDYDRVTYAYRYTYGLAPAHGLYPVYLYPHYSPRLYHRHHWHYHRHWHSRHWHRHW